MFMCVQLLLGKVSPCIVYLLTQPLMVILHLSIACLCRLGKCIGFKEEALRSFAQRAEIYAFAPYHDILDTPRYKYSQYFQFEVPNALSTVFEERESGMLGTL